MCAIIGVLGKKLPSREQCIKARDVMTHRGPDDAGIYYAPEERCALGHRRLSIIDLSEAGRQPFFSNDGRFVLVYNGEIYNYIEIKKELGKHYNFKTKTDTEVLLAAYSVWGKKCLDKLNGMFAFAIWDKEKKELFCARDRFGIKPFFYCIKDGTFYFSSEIKGLLALDVKPQPNESIIFQYLYYRFYDHGEETFFDGIKRLSGGCFLVRKGNSVKISRWWDLADKQKDYSSWPQKKIYDTFKNLLEDSIKLRFRSDVPVGLSLSSGLDSNILFFYSKQIFKPDFHLFSRCFQSETYNECSLLGEILNTEQKKMWHKGYFTPRQALQLAYEVNRAEDQPFGGIPTIGGYHLHKTTRKVHVPVVLEGQGLDEILAGYKYYLMEYQKDVNGERLKCSGKDAHEMSRLDYSQDMAPFLNRNILNKKFMKKFDHTKLSFRTPFRSHLLNAQYQDILYTKIPRVLRFNDHVSMSHGRELRVPYLDYRLVEFCFFLPSQYKIRGEEQKILARDVMGKYMPPTIYTRQKQSFSAVQVEWLRRYYKKEVFSLLGSPSFKARKYWNHEKLLEEVERFYEGEGTNSFFIWQCINLEIWFREFID